MRDRRDYVIAALAAALVFSLGLWVGRGGSLASPAGAQDAGSTGSDPAPSTTATPSGVPEIGPPSTPNPRPGLEGRTTPHTASDSNSNNRFVAVTTPVGSGESVMFVLDAEREQLLAYRFVRSKGLELVAARKIDYDLQLSSYKDFSEWSRDGLKAVAEKHRAKSAAKDSK